MPKALRNTASEPSIPAPKSTRQPKCPFCRSSNVMWFSANYYKLLPLTVTDDYRCLACGWLFERDTIVHYVEVK